MNIFIMTGKSKRKGHISVTTVRLNSYALLSIPPIEAKKIGHFGQDSNRIKSRSKSAEALSIITKDKDDVTDIRAQSAEKVVLPQLDSKTQEVVDRMRNTVQQDVARIDKLLEKAHKNEPRKHGTGSWGGPIARRVKSPGPHNGIHYEATGIRSPKLHLTEAQMKEIMKDHKDIYLDDWDHNFTVANRLSEKIARYDLIHDQLYKEEIQKFKTEEDANSLKNNVYIASGIELFEEYDTREEGLSIDNSFNPLSKATLPGADGKTSPTAANNRSCTRDSANKSWLALVTTLHECASYLNYKDFTDIACMRSPPEFAIQLIAFIGVLLGLEPTWQAAKRTMFHDINALHNFLCFVEPLSIPMNRIEQALHIKDTLLPGLSLKSCKGVYGPKSFSILSLWVLRFCQLARIRVAVQRSINFSKDMHSGFHESSLISSVGTMPSDVLGGASQGPRTEQANMKSNHKSKNKAKDVIGSDLIKKEFFEQLAANPTLFSGYFNPGTSVETLPFGEGGSMDDAANAVLANMASQIDVQPIQLSSESITNASSLPAKVPSSIAMIMKRSSKIDTAPLLDQKQTQNTHDRQHTLTLTEDDEYEEDEDFIDAEGAVVSPSKLLHPNPPVIAKSEPTKKPALPLPDDEYPDDDLFEEMNGQTMSIRETHGHLLYLQAEKEALQAGGTDQSLGMESFAGSDPISDNNIAATHQMTESITSSEVLPKTMPESFHIGSKIEGNLHGRGLWCPGKIAGMRTDGTFDIDYDHGEEEIGAVKELMRPVQSRDGAKVEGNYRGRGRWYPGTIARTNSDGTFDIDYDDGEKELGVEQELVRLVETIKPDALTHEDLGSTAPLSEAFSSISISAEPVFEERPAAQESSDYANDFESSASIASSTVQLAVTAALSRVATPVPKERPAAQESSDYANDFESDD